MPMTPMVAWRGAILKGRREQIAIEIRRSETDSTLMGGLRTHPSPTHSRVAGIDLARALAVIGMLMVHVGPTGYRGLAGTLYGMPHGRAAVLFVLVAGIGTSLLAASRRLSGRDVRLRLAWYAIILLPFGLWLQALDHHVLVVLQTYAALFVVGILAISLPDRWLLGIGVGVALIGPLAFLAGRVYWPGTFNRSAVDLGDGWEILSGIVATGPYPVITWAAPFLIGMWLGRRNLASPRVQWWLVVSGTVITLLAYGLTVGLQAMFDTPVHPVTWSHVMVDHAHSQMPLWLIGAIGSSCLVLGFALAAAEVLGRLTWPLVAMGQMALTFYAGHLLAFHFAQDTLTSTNLAQASRISLVMLGVALGAAVIWRSLLPRGPLEMLLHAPWFVARNMRLRASGLG